MQSPCCHDDGSNWQFSGEWGGTLLLKSCKVLSQPSVIRSCCSRLSRLITCLTRSWHFVLAVRSRNKWAMKETKLWVSMFKSRQVYHTVVIDVWVVFFLFFLQLINLFESLWTFVFFFLLFLHSNESQCNSALRIWSLMITSFVNLLKCGFD